MKKLSFITCLFVFKTFSQNYVETKPKDITGSIKVWNAYSGSEAGMGPGPATVINTFNKLTIAEFSPYRKAIGSQISVETGGGSSTVGIESTAQSNLYTYSGGTIGVYGHGVAAYSGSVGVQGEARGVTSSDIGDFSGVAGIASGEGNVNIYTGSSYYGVKGFALNTGNYNSYNYKRYYGVYGYARGASTSFNYGVYGELASGTAGFAGYFNGAVHVNGTLSKSAGTFKIDHPLDPLNKYLSHSFVESPDMMNIYNGNVTTDQNGKAIVTLPSYFEALNMDFRYQLTAIGEFSQVIVKEKIKQNKFVIATDKPNIEVSWQVTGIRNDPYAQKNRVVPEENKPTREQGQYLNADSYGLLREESINAVKHKEEKSKAKNE